MEGVGHLNGASAITGEFLGRAEEKGGRSGGKTDGIFKGIHTSAGQHENEF